jgi:hypothetical protein
MFGGSLLGIQNQVDHLVIAKALLERRFDDSSIQDAIFMAAVFDADLELIYDDDDCLISTREADLVAETERALREEQNK